jgi:hypothetical protein
MHVFIAAHHQKISVPYFGGQHCGRQIWADTASSTNAVKLPHRCVATARALVHEMFTDASDKDSAEWAIYHSFWGTYKQAPRLAVAL